MESGGRDGGHESRVGEGKGGGGVEGGVLGGGGVLMKRCRGRGDVGRFGNGSGVGVVGHRVLLVARSVPPRRDQECEKTHVLTLSNHHPDVFSPSARDQRVSPDPSAELSNRRSLDVQLLGLLEPIEAGRGALARGSTARVGEVG